MTLKNLPTPKTSTSTKPATSFGYHPKPAGITCRKTPNNPPSASSLMTPWTPSNAITPRSKACCQKTMARENLDKQRLGRANRFSRHHWAWATGKAEAKTSLAESTSIFLGSLRMLRAKRAGNSTRPEASCSCL